MTTRKIARGLAVLACAAVAGASAAPAQAGAGDLDPGFGVGGVLRGAIGSYSNASARAVAATADGGLVVAGEASTTADRRFALARYDANGNLLAAFGQSGVLSTSVGEAGASISDVAVQPDGKIVAAGRAILDDTGVYAVVRYNPDGSLDTAFGTGGRVLTPVGDESAFVDTVALQPDGKILLAGQAGRDFMLARYTKAGVLDSAFGSGGKVRAPVAGAPPWASHSWGAQAMALQADGGIVVANAGGDDLVLARFRPDGSPDPTFGTNGQAQVHAPADVDVEALAVQLDGKLVVAGEIDAGGFGSEVMVARVLPTGAPDPTFGSLGVTQARLEFLAWAVDVHVRFDGRIVAVAETGDGTHRDFGAARFQADGKLDPSFGTGGVAVTAVGDPRWARPGGAAVLAGDDFAVAGGASTTAGRRFATVRYDAEGDVDAAYGDGGIVLTGLETTTDSWISSAVQASDGRLIVAGTGTIDDGFRDQPRAFLRRYSAAGDLDTSFGENGTVLAEEHTGTELLRQPDGALVLAGWRWGSRYVVLRRYRADGSVDPTFGAAGRVQVEVGSHTSVGAAALGPDGKIVVAARSGGGMTLLRFRADGSLDETFGGDGRVDGIGDWSTSAQVLLAESSGKLLVATRANESDRLWRLHDDGSVDVAFGDQGHIEADEWGFTALVRQPDGKLLGAEQAAGRMAVSRWDAEGDLDPSFGTGGKTTVELVGHGSPGSVWLALEPEGRIVAATSLEQARTRYRGAVALARLEADGSRDTSFGQNGVAVHTLSSDYASQASGLLRDTDGRLVVWGGQFIGDYFAGRAASRFFVARFRSLPDPPVTTLSAHPPARTTGSRADFEFSAPNAVSYACALDGGAERPCASPAAYEGLDAGVHTFSVRATDAHGQTGPATTHTWQIEAVRSETESATEAPPPPAPNGDSPAAGGGSVTERSDSAPRESLWLRPLAGAARAGATRRTLFRLPRSGAGFRGAAVVDATRGSVEVVLRGAAAPATARLRGALFHVAASHGADGLVVRLRHARQTCRTRAARRLRPTLLRAWTRGNVVVETRFGTAAAERPAHWTVTDGCRATLTTVRTGAVRLHDASSGRSFVVRARGRRSM